MVWVYAIVDGRARPSLGRVRRLPGGAGPPRTLPLDTYLTAIVADVPASLFSSAALDARLADAEWVAQCASAHHAVVDRIAHTRAVAPFRVFTIFESDARVRAGLTPLRRRLRAALERVRGRTEWVVRVFRPAKAAPTATRAATTGTEFLRARHQSRLAETERARAVTRSALEVTRALAKAADDHVIRPVDAGASALVDAAFLIRTPRVSAFRRSLSILSRDLRSYGCRVTMTGPWPPYSFVDQGEDAGV